MNTPYSTVNDCSLSILKPESHLCRVFGEAKRPAGTYLELDPRSLTLSASWREVRICGERDFRKAKGEVFRFELPSPYLSRRDVERAMELVAPECQAICEEYWGGDIVGDICTVKSAQAMMCIKIKLRAFISGIKCRFVDTVFHGEDNV